MRQLRHDTNRLHGLRLLRPLDVEALKVGGRRPCLKISGIEDRGPWDPSSDDTLRFTRAAQRHFDFPALSGDGRYLVGSAFAGPQDLDGILAKKRISAFLDKGSGSIRLVYRELVFRAEFGASTRDIAGLLSKHRLDLRAPRRFDGPFVVAYDSGRQCDGESLLERCDSLLARDWVTHAAPNFVSQYEKCGTVDRAHIWHLLQVKAAGAWRIQPGDSSITIAIVDDGVDVEHPTLIRSIAKRPDPSEPMDVFGRNFCVADDHPDHFDPRPARFGGPDPTDPRKNDIHGTACAGVAASAGPIAWGMAPGCRILPVKVFPTSEPTSDHQVARGIRYAALHADVICCSWSGPPSDEVTLALQDAARFGRGGRGCVVVCAAGNAPGDESQGGPVTFPGTVDRCMAVGASTSEDLVAGYSNRGPEISVVAPSQLGKQDAIFTTDVSESGRGFDPGDGTRGQYTGRFGGTSSAAAMVAGLAALVLCRRPTLMSDEVRGIIEQNAKHIGADAGRGRIDAEATLRAVG